MCARRIDEARRLATAECGDTPPIHPCPNRCRKPLRERLPLGCRVQFTAAAQALFGLPAQWLATVVGHDAPHVRLIRDGTGHRESWPASALARLEGPHA